MNVNGISENNFGLRITDNMPKEIVSHLWLKNFPSEVKEIFPKIRNMADDSCEVTIREFVPGKPCEVWVKKGVEGLKRLYVTFVSTKERQIKRGRPKKHPDSMIKSIFSPIEFKELLAKTLTEFSS